VKHDAAGVPRAAADSSSPLTRDPQDFTWEIITRGTDGTLSRLHDFDLDRDWSHKSKVDELVRVSVGFLAGGNGSAACDGVCAAAAANRGQTLKRKMP
jgi:hypothetical protein